MQDKRAERKTVHVRNLRILLTVLFFVSVLISSGCGKKTADQGDNLEELSVSEDSEGTEDTSELKKDPGDGRDPDEGHDEAGEGEDNDAKETVFVYVCGAVNTPGVYELGKDARVFEAVELAGGLTADASAESVNQARTVTDGEQIYVLTREEAETQGTGVIDSTVTEGTDKKVNINTAGKEELMTLTGIGEAKAQSILDYREEHGRFGSIEDLMQIEGIKEGVFNKIKEDIMI